MPATRPVPGAAAFIFPTIRGAVLNLTGGSITNNTCAIDADAFTGCGTVYIFAPAGGTTEDWCRDRTGIVFIAQ